jgi:hypothetical protein
MMTENSKPAVMWNDLLPVEQQTLRNIADDSRTSTPLVILEMFEMEGLVKLNFVNGEGGNYLTDLGRAVLAQADSKPTAIHASEWNTIAEEVKVGRCVVSVEGDPDHSTPIENVLQNPDGSYTAFYGITDTHNWSMWKDVKRLAVEWLPPADTAPTATVETLQAEIARLTSELEAARAALRDISELSAMGRGQWVGVEPDYSPNWTHEYKFIDDRVEELYDILNWERGRGS